MIIDKSLENELYDYGIYEAWQFIRNTVKTLTFAEFCKDTITKLISDMTEEYQEWQDKLFSELFSQESRIKTVSVTTDNLPSYIVKVAEQDASAQFLLEKLTKDFFQYIRNLFDSMAQIANVALLVNRAKKADRVDFPLMADVLSQQAYSQAYPDMSSWFSRIKTSAEFEYIDAFNNRTKHTYDIYLKVSMSLIGGDNSAEINPFVRKGTLHGKKDIAVYLNEIYLFASSAFDDFLDMLRREYPKKLYSENRINKLKAYQQKFKGPPESNFAITYIEITQPVSLMPEEIFVLLINRTEDGEIYHKNCTIDTIYIKAENEEHEYIGKYVAVELHGDDTLLKYRKYKKEIPIAGSLPLVFQAMHDWQENPIYFKVNPFIEFTTVSDDNEFLARVQLPL